MVEDERVGAGVGVVGMEDFLVFKTVAVLEMDEMREETMCLTAVGRMGMDGLSTGRCVKGRARAHFVCLEGDQLF
jgi:hypothetical protein